MRPATVADAPAIAAIYAPYVRDTAVSFELEPPDAAETARRIAKISATYPYLVYCGPDDRVAGYCYASRHSERAAYRWDVDTSVYVDPPFCGRGVGTALYTRLFELLERQGFRRAYAGITVPNAASEALHRKFGFQPIGTFRATGYKLGQWRDVLWLDKPLGDGDASEPGEIGEPPPHFAKRIVSAPPRLNLTHNF